MVFSKLYTSPCYRTSQSKGSTRRRLFTTLVKHIVISVYLYSVYVLFNFVYYIIYEIISLRNFTLHYIFNNEIFQIYDIHERKWNQQEMPNKFDTWAFHLLVFFKIHCWSEGFLVGSLCCTAPLSLIIWHSVKRKGWLCQTTSWTELRKFLSVLLEMTCYPNFMAFLNWW